jgi:hypothetical protein
MRNLLLCHSLICIHFCLQLSELNDAYILSRNISLGHAVVLGRYATRRKVAGSRPDEVNF